MQILLFTAVGSHNLGDELIALSEVQILRERFPESSITVATYDSVSTLALWEARATAISYFPNAFFSSPLRNICAFFKTLYQVYASDLIVVGGGGIFYDDESGSNISRLAFQWRLRLFLAFLLRRPVWYWSIGLELRRPESFAQLRSLFTCANTTISVRDSVSQTMLREAGIASLLLPDPVWMYNAPPISSHEKIVGLALRAGYLPDERITVQAMIDYCTSEGFRIALLHHSFHPSDLDKNDAHFFSEFALPDNAIVSQSMTETLQLYQRCQFMVAMRLHSMILSALHGIPFLGISYSKKTDEALRQLEYSYIQPAGAFDFERFKTSFQSLHDNRQGLSIALRDKCATIQASFISLVTPVLYGLESSLAANDWKGKNSR